MNLLFVHQNFPGQWKHLAPRVASLPGSRVVALAMHDRPIHAPGVEVRRYKVKRSSSAGIHPWSVDFETQMIRGEACAEQAIELRQAGFSPSVICAHPGWGEALFLKDVWPEAKVLGYHEFHYDQTHSGFDPEFAPERNWRSDSRLRAKNAAFLLGYEDIDWGVTPTRFQWSTLPERVRNRTSIIHDGIDIEQVRPNAKVALLLKKKEITLTRASTVITFVSRNLEPTRGFHRFMRALPLIQANHPNAEIFIIGREGRGYGAPHPSGKSYKEAMLEELSGKLNPNNIHFVGPLPYGQLLKLLQLSTVHVYFTVPFVLSWSLMEAMACGALIVGSRTAPLQEVIQHGQNGLLVDYFDTEALAMTIREVIEAPDRYAPLRQAARQTIVERYALGVSLRRQQALIEALASQLL